MYWVIFYQYYCDLALTSSIGRTYIVFMWCPIVGRFIVVQKGHTPTSYKVCRYNSQLLVVSSWSASGVQILWSSIWVTASQKPFSTPLEAPPAYTYSTGFHDLKWPPHRVILLRLYYLEAHSHEPHPDAMPNSSLWRPKSRECEISNSNHITRYSLKETLKACDAYVLA